MRNSMFDLDISKFFIGADRFTNEIRRISQLADKAMSNYPPFNIIKLTDNKYVIELAVAGFTKQTLDLELEGNKLVIKGDARFGESDPNVDEYLYKGIANRAFSQEFTLADNIEVKNADLVNGVLKVWLEAMIPFTKGSKIDINDGTGQTTKPEFLRETKTGDE